MAFVVLLSCKSARPEMAADSTQLETVADSFSLEETFQADSLSPSNLRAFENRAVQKLHDAMDLIEILSNPNNDDAFRAQAKSMLLENFESNKNEISLVLPDIEPFRYTISQFADSLTDNRFLPLKLRLADSNIHEPLASKGDNQLKGMIYFSLEPTANYKTLYPKDMEVEIVLKKIPKDFGTTTKEVWEVFLGDLHN
jgi:hypothetical protein